MGRWRARPAASSGSAPTALEPGSSGRPQLHGVPVERRGRLDQPELPQKAREADIARIVERARRLLEDLPESIDRAWLECREGAMALLEDGDPDRAHAHGAEGIRISRLVRSTDFEMLSRAI